MDSNSSGHESAHVEGREERCEEHGFPFYACLDLCEYWGQVLLIVFILVCVGSFLEAVVRERQPSDGDVCAQ